MMIEKLSDTISYRMVAKEVIESNRREYFSYGIALMLSSGIITFGILFIGIVSGMFLETAVYSVFYWINKKYTGGYHCNSFYQCMALSLGLYSLLVVCYKLTTTKQNLLILWLALGGLLLLLHIVRSFKGTQFLLQQIKDIDQQLKRKVAIWTLGVIVCLLLVQLEIYSVLVPLSYGIFVSSILYQRKECT